MFFKKNDHKNEMTLLFHDTHGFFTDEIEVLYQNKVISMRLFGGKWEREDVRFATHCPKKEQLDLLAFAQSALPDHRKELIRRNCAPNPIFTFNNPKTLDMPEVLLSPHSYDVVIHDKKEPLLFHTMVIRFYLYGGSVEATLYYDFKEKHGNIYRGHGQIKSIFATHFEEKEKKKIIHNVLNAYTKGKYAMDLNRYLSFSYEEVGSSGKIIEDSKPMWFSEEKCTYVRAPILSEEEPVAYRCIDPFLDRYIPLYDRSHMLKDAIAFPPEAHIMSSMDIAVHLGFVPLTDEGYYRDETMSFFGFNRYGSMLYDVSQNPKYKAWRLKQLFD